MGRVLNFKQNFGKYLWDQIGTDGYTLVNIRTGLADGDCSMGRTPIWLKKVNHDLPAIEEVLARIEGKAVITSDCFELKEKIGHRYGMIYVNKPVVHSCYEPNGDLTAPLLEFILGFKAKKIYTYNCMQKYSNFVKVPAMVAGIEVERMVEDDYKPIERVKNMNKTWTEAEKKFVIDNAATMKDSELVVRLAQLSGRTISVQALRKKRQELGIKKLAGRGRCGLRAQEKNV